MSSLLSLPRELVDNIIEIVLLSPRLPPKDPEAARAHGQRIPDEVSFCRSWKYTDVLYETSPQKTSSSSLPLLLVNKQIKLQTQKAIDRLIKAHHLDYHVDVMFVDEHQLWPTFLSVPTLSTRINNLYADIRIFAPTRVKPLTGYSGFRGGDGAPPAIVWAFYVLLERFLRRGASYVDVLPNAVASERRPDRAEEDFADREVTVNTLVIKFSMPDDPSCVVREDESPESYRLSRGDRTTETEKRTIFPPKPLAQFVASRLRGLLAMGYHTAEYGGILYERIGRILILVDNEPECEFDLGKELQALDYTDPSQTFGHVWPRELRLDAFTKWKQSALEKRRRHGLDFFQVSLLD